MSPRACVMGHDIMIVLDATTITSGFMHECAPRSVTRNPFSCSSATLYCSYEDALLEVVEAIFFARLHARPRESRVFVRGCEGMPCAFWRALRVILSDRLCVRELTIIPAPPLPLHSTEQVTGLVMGTERESVSAAAVLSGHTLRPLARRLPAAAPGSVQDGGVRGCGDVRAHRAAGALLAALKRHPADARRPLAQNVILCGCPLLSARVSAACLSTHLPGCVRDSGAATLLPHLADLAFSDISAGGVPVESLAWLAGTISLVAQ